MSALSPIEPSKVLETIQSVNIKKINFEVKKLELPIGVEGTFGTIHHPGAALAVPITEDGEIILLRQYRFAVSRRILEFPAGTLEKDEDPLTSIKRELQEETGYKADQWDPLGIMLPAPGYSDEIIHLFLARGIEPLINKPEGDEDEDIEVLKMSAIELSDAIACGDEALDGKSITAWYRTCQFLKI